MKTGITLRMIATGIIAICMAAGRIHAQTQDQIRAQRAAQAAAEAAELLQELDAAQAAADAQHPQHTTSSGFQAAATTSSYSGSSGGSDDPQPLDAQVVPNYEVIDIGTFEPPTGNQSVAYGINNNGQVVGFNYVSTSSYHAFLYTNGAIEDLGLLPGAAANGNSVAFGINSSGQIVGTSTSANGSTHAFLYSNGIMQDIGQNVARGINSNGQIVGNNGSQAFVYTNGVSYYLGTLGGSSSDAYGINDSGQIVGTADWTNGLTHAFLYENGVMKDINPSGYPFSWATAINNRSQVVGYARRPPTSVVFLYEDGLTRIIEPQVAYGINSSGQIVGDQGPDGTPKAGLYMNSQTNILNDLIPPSAGWSLTTAYAINDSGQIVGYGGHAGQTHAFLLNPLPLGSKQAIMAQPSIKTYGTPPVKQTGKDSVVVITHGWTPGNTDTLFINVMSNSITTNLTTHELNNWQAHGYFWEENSRTLTPDVAINHAHQEGINLGNTMATNGWTRVHFIAHSAGAELIQTATEIIKTYSPTTIVQCTFLDPYLGLYFQGVHSYGSMADWSDRYAAHGDIENIPIEFTLKPLNWAYNADVTDLDPSPANQGLFSGIHEQLLCTFDQSSHGWPIAFYQNTIDGTVTPEYDGFGFPLSQEAGGWPAATNAYHVGNVDSVTNLGPQSACEHNPTANAPTPVTQVTFQQAVWQSLTGVQTVNGASITLASGSPSWIAFLAPKTNAVNVLDFDADFTSAAGAAGLLTLYWDANVIGSIDERMVGQGMDHYTMSFPLAQDNSTHVLGFRLDPFTNIQSVVTVTNVILSQIGVREPFTLGITTNMVNGSLMYQLTGQAGFDYGLQASTDLINWTQIAILENTNGVVNFFDPWSTNYTQRFYRAIAPY